MKTDKLKACSVTGFVDIHASACEAVAKQMNCIILFREPGVMACGLIKEKYCMKGFRIDTKSCNWGPMSGFVCVDPRLTKDSVYEDRNMTWTSEALSGHIVERFFGKVTDAQWVADVMPIAISKQRIEELTSKGVIKPQADGSEFVGESKATKGDTLLYWRLVPVGNATNWWLRVDGGTPSGYYVICVNTRGAHAFKQRYPSGVNPIRFRGHETILGLINPGTKHRGFKACVTADYDLF
ncbi:MAG: anthrax toxin-like adenylyl cyclase domain-containing protein, partial [Desulfobacterales bacterium]|nr:anthrax toxin-like adenylyl cyclase domain-containing protein [Desulfobacterales bacterium]